MAQVYLSLGSNKGNLSENINKAVWYIHSLPKVKVNGVSRIFETKIKCGKKEGIAHFATIRLETEVSAEVLLGMCQGIETAMGKEHKKGADFIIDIDILRFDDMEIDKDYLKLPHPELLNRPYIMACLLSMGADSELRKRLLELGEENVKILSDGIYLPL